MRHLITFIAAAAAVTGLAAPAQAADCDVQCQLDLQQQNAVPRTSFYDPPPASPWALPGTVIRKQVTTDYSVGGVTVPATRIMYHSRTSSGRDVATTAVVLVPKGKAPAGGWPVVVDAHGSSGIGRPCAPSLMKDLYHGNQMLAFVNRGFAVVAPDYAGLGTDGKPELVNKTAEANDVIFGQQAARRVRSDLSSRWVLWGHSQGGGAAMGVAERQRILPQPGYLGTVLTSPVADLSEVVAHVAATPGYGAFAAMIAQGAHFSDPSVQPQRLLSAEAYSRIGITAVGCLGAAFAAYADLTGPQLVTPAYSTDPAFRKYLRDNSAGTRALGGPVLLLQGEADTVVPVGVTDQIAKNLCRLGTRLTYKTYPGLEHDTYPWVQGIDDGAMPDILAWTADRFAGRTAPATCTS
ncbi:alpha/beta fold hydrolase [Kribbella sp. NPDC051952]|uniref:alpha/beta fold hydrolase n=1 Tax=Kribbella sp. NPDC051952 TaxID=3154851 RepID=UPI003425B36A